MNSGHRSGKPKRKPSAKKPSGTTAKENKRKRKQRERQGTENWRSATQEHTQQFGEKQRKAA